MSDEIRCPHCRLPLRISRDPASPAIDYDREEWSRRCRYPQLGSPAMCLAEPRTTDNGAPVLKATGLQMQHRSLQVSGEPAERFAGGARKAGAATRNGDDLALEFDVSAATMRKAPDLPESGRSIARVQERGPFVDDPSTPRFASPIGASRLASPSCSK